MTIKPQQVYEIRGTDFLIDVGYESSLGIYGDEFWHEISIGNYESATFDFLESLYSNGFECFLDIGAATGCMSLYAASTGMTVIAVEPQELVYSALKKNLRLNPRLSFRISMEFALVTTSHNPEVVSQSFTPGAAGPISSGALTSTLITLDELIKKFPKDKKVAIKIDIEGAEFPLLSKKSTIMYLSQRKPLIYVALHPGFKKPLKENSNYFSRFWWRIQALQDVIKFYFSVSRRARILVAASNKKVGLFGLILALGHDKKDFLLVF
jgi:FkbM family methyltransferase